MGLFLTLLPLRGICDLEEENIHCRDFLTFDPDQKIYDQIDPFDKTKDPPILTDRIPVSLQVEIYGEKGSRRTREDMYRRLLRFVFAREFGRLELPADTSSRNKAIKAFIDALPGNTPIILYWH